MLDRPTNQHTVFKTRSHFKPLDKLQFFIPKKVKLRTKKVIIKMKCNIKICYLLIDWPKSSSQVRILKQFLAGNSFLSPAIREFSSYVNLNTAQCCIILSLMEYIEITVWNTNKSILGSIFMYTCVLPPRHHSVFWWTLTGPLLYHSHFNST